MKFEELLKKLEEVREERNLLLEKLKNKGPNSAEVIRINSRWAQVFSIAGESLGIRYLDDLSIEEIDLSEYTMVTYYKSTSLSLFEYLKMGTFSETEIRNIHHNQEENFDIKDLISVFGEYRKKLE